MRLHNSKYLHRTSIMAVSTSFNTPPSYLQSLLLDVAKIGVFSMLENVLFVTVWTVYGNMYKFLRSLSYTYFMFNFSPRQSRTKYIGTFQFFSNFKTSVYTKLPLLRPPLTMLANGPALLSNIVQGCGRGEMLITVSIFI